MSRWRGGGGFGRCGGRGLGGGYNNLGPGEECICPNCGHREFHPRGVPCSSIKCPWCGILMTR